MNRETRTAAEESVPRPFTALLFGIGRLKHELDLMQQRIALVPRQAPQTQFKTIFTV
jgi:hypothetical protein